MKLIIKVVIILLSFNSLAFSQNWTKTDTIIWSNNQLIIELPVKSHSHYETYEEGFFRTISCFLDSGVITIHCGGMVNLPLVDLTKYTVKSKFVLDKDVQVLRGYFDSVNNGIKRRKYFREEDYFKYGMTIMYENVDETKLKEYDYIIDNVNLIRLSGERFTKRNE